MDKVRAALGDRKEVDDRRMARMQLLVWRADDEAVLTRKFSKIYGRQVRRPYSAWAD